MMIRTVKPSVSVHRVEPMTVHSWFPLPLRKTKIESTSQSARPKAQMVKVYWTK
uniref:Uncharacterized protein n=1 Tax=Anguilla anguilla TaxID=7936 RepID=A0A0E9UZ81_ANGAN